MAFLVKDIYLWSVAGCVATRNQHTGEFGDCSYNPPAAGDLKAKTIREKGRKR
jgi:hypothetical protein